MRRSTAFWAIVLIVIGVALLLGNLGFFASLGVSMWDLIWPLALIALGVWILWGILTRPRRLEAEEVVIPLEGARQARVRISHGAGSMRVDASAGPGELAAGTFGGGLDYRARLDGDVLAVTMRVPPGSFWGFFPPWGWASRGGFAWSFGLNREVPLSLTLETGAGEMNLDLTDLRVTDLTLKTGASSTHLTLPANAGHTRARVESGAAAVRIRVPSDVAARIRVEAGLAGITVDRGRFPRVGGVYVSPDYDTAPNKVDIDIQTGVGSVDVR